MSQNIQLLCASELSSVSRNEDKEFFVNCRLAAIAGAQSTDDERAPVSITAVVDKSGSMRGEKLRLVKVTLEFVINQLKPQDRLGVVSYDHCVKTELQLTNMTPEGKEKAMTCINNIQVGGSTNLSDGLYTGLRQQLQFLKETGGRSTITDATTTTTTTTTTQQQQEQQPPAVAPPPATAPCLMDLQLGNLYFAGGGETNQTVLFVKGVNNEEDIGQVIKSVTFKIPDSEDVVLTTAPFEVPKAFAEKVNVAVEMELHNGSKQTFSHTVSFASALNADIVHLNTAAPAAPQLEVTEPTIIPNATAPMEVELTMDGESTTTPSGATADTTQTRTATSVCSVWLFTDGMANAGDTSQNVITKKATELLQGFPISLSTFGYGAGHNEQLLSAIAEVGHGQYYFVDDPQLIGAAMVECLGGLLSVVGQCLKLKLTAPPGSELKKVYSSFETTTQDNETVVSLPDIFSEETRDIMCKVKVTSVPMALPEAMPTIVAELTYTDPTTSSSVTVTTKATVERPEVAPENQEVPDIVDEQKNRIVAAEAIEVARAAANSGNFEVARERLKAVSGAVSCSKSAATPYCQKLMEDIQDVEQGMATPQLYAEMGRQQAQQMVNLHSKQRACGTKKGRNLNAQQSALVSQWSSKRR